jgi:excisionase family DNA binding protein
MTARLLLRPEEAADVLGIGRSKLYELLAAGVIESVQIGSSRRVPVEGLHDFVQRLRSGRELVDGRASTYATQRRAGAST